ncbi:MAG TPA: PQQ-binding-like beta-propeller repeat protein, partial [Gemmataceae bacterium]|nr:PQQ-binding-like beta-propeller repeat protein [Gemmataceae bacterium]
MKTTLPLLVAAAVLPAGPGPARADPEVDRALALHIAGKHAEALAAVDARRAHLPAEARLKRWSIPFGSRPVPVVQVGQKHLVVAGPGYRREKPVPPSGEITGPPLDDSTGRYDFDTVITAFDATTGKRLWTRCATGHMDVALDDRTDAVYVWRAKLFRLKPTTGETEQTVDLPAKPGRVEALVIAGRPHVPRPRQNLPNDDPQVRVVSHDVDTGKTAERDLLMPVRLSPDERRVLAITSSGRGTTISARPFRGDKPDWKFEYPSTSHSDPFWLDGDVSALAGNHSGKAEVVRLGGADGKVCWRFPLPRGAYVPGADRLPGNTYPGRTWSAVGPCGDYLLAIGGEGSLYFLDPKTGKLAAKASPTTSHLAFPRLVDGNLVVCATDGIRAIPWDVLLRRRTPDEGDLVALRARCLHALGKTPEALAELGEVLAFHPDRADAWLLKAQLSKAAGLAFDEVAARCRHLELTGRDSSPELRERWGLVKRISTGHDLRADLKAAGNTVYAGTAAGWLYRIDTRSLEVEKKEYPGPVNWMSATAGVKAMFDRTWQELGAWSESDPQAPITGPLEWRVVSGRDGRAVRWQGKYYRPVPGGTIKVLEGDTVRSYKTRLDKIDQWEIHVSPWGLLGYGSGGVYELDENLCPARRLIGAANPGFIYNVSL